MTSIDFLGIAGGMGKSASSLGIVSVITLVGAVGGKLLALVVSPEALPAIGVGVGFGFGLILIVRRQYQTSAIEAQAEEILMLRGIMKRRDEQHAIDLACKEAELETCRMELKEALKSNVKLEVDAARRDARDSDEHAAISD